MAVTGVLPGAISLYVKPNGKKGSFPILSNSISPANLVQVQTLASGSVATGSASWQLASGHYEPRENNMVIEHPRPDAETNSYAQHRWTYTGLPWSTRICVRDGSYPFRFEVDATSAGKGMYIGAQLVAVGDHLEADATYAKLFWDNPTAGTHTITVSVYDQEYQRGSSPSAVATITWTLVVDQVASKYVAVDPVNGNDTTGTGTFAAPFRTIQRIHNDNSATTTFANRQIWLRAGTTNLDGMTDRGGNYALASGTNPVVFVGYPGETCVLSLYEGWFVGRGAGDIMFKNVTIRHASEFGTKMHFYATVTGASRVSFHDCDLTNYFAGSNTGSENPALIYTTTGATTSRLTVEGCSLHGQLGAILTSYMLDGGTFQHNRLHSATLTETDPSNSHAALYLKDSTRNFTVRANDAWDSVTGGIDGFVGCGGQNTGGFTYSAENILIEYNKISFTGQRSIENTFEYGSPATGVHIRRNSCAQDIHHGFSNTPSDYNVTRNAAVGGITNMPGGAVQTENLTGSGLFDSSMNLTGANRTSYLGIRGAEIA